MENIKDYFREMDFEAFGTGGFATAPTALPGLIKVAGTGKIPRPGNSTKKGTGRKRPMPHMITI